MDEPVTQMDRVSASEAENPSSSLGGLTTLQFKFLKWLAKEQPVEQAQIFKDSLATPDNLIYLEKAGLLEIREVLADPPATLSVWYISAKYYHSLTYRGWLLTRVKELEDVVS